MLKISKPPFSIDSLYYSVVPGTWGLMGLAASDRGLLHIQTVVPDETGYVDFLQRSFTCVPEKKPKRLKPVADQLRLYLEGKLLKFDYPLDLSHGTAFQKQVWKTLASIPYGETRSYAWLAQAVKRPNACRAVGNANGKNPLPILLPCHRVIQSNGDLGGYSGGLHIKKYLLELEETGHASL